MEAAGLAIAGLSPAGLAGNALSAGCGVRPGEEVRPVEVGPVEVGPVEVKAAEVAVSTTSTAFGNRLSGTIFSSFGFAAGASAAFAGLTGADLAGADLASGDLASGDLASGDLASGDCNAGTLAGAACGFAGLKTASGLPVVPARSARPDSSDVFIWTPDILQTCRRPNGCYAAGRHSRRPGSPVQTVRSPEMGEIADPVYGKLIPATPDYNSKN